jgi:hypothetical protein
MYFFVPETVYFDKERETEVIFDKNTLRIYEIVMPEPKKTYRQRLTVFRGRVSNAGFWRTSFKPIPLITFPVVVFAAFTYSIYAGGLTLIALLQDTVFSAPPYNLSSSASGLTNLPLFGVGLVGTLTAGYTADFIIQWMTKHNNGVYEPEFRLVLMTVAATLSTVVYVGFGFSVAWGATLYIPMLSWGYRRSLYPSL